MYLVGTLPNVSRLPKLQRTMTIFKYTKAQFYRLGQTCKCMLAAEDWQRLKYLGIRAPVRGCRAGKKETKQQSTSHIPTRVTQRPSADRVHKSRQQGHGVYKHVATVDSHTSTVSSRTSCSSYHMQAEIRHQNVSSQSVLYVQQDIRSSRCCH